MDGWYFSYNHSPNLSKIMAIISNSRIYSNICCSAFVAMSLLGKTINVISLAGIAFAVGMVVDLAIVVLKIF